MQQAGNPWMDTMLLGADHQNIPDERAQVSLCINAGLLHWSGIRNMVAMLQQDGWNLTIWEGSGWGKRPFIVKGDYKAIEQIEQWLNRE